MAKKILKIFKRHWPVLLIWIMGLFLRCYRQNWLLGFYYDQGRDAQMAADIISGTNFPAIGPTTGIEGLFLGPFWYYLITPGYFIGGGSPATASYFVVFIESLTIPLIYVLLSRYWSKGPALLASFFWAFSHYLIRSSRWFSNPTPIPFFAVLIILISLEITQKHRYKLFPWLLLSLSLSLQLEAASAVFFIPTLILFFFTDPTVIKKIPSKHYLTSLLFFSLPFLPLLAFELKNKFLITGNFVKFLTGASNTHTGRSWAIPSFSFAIDRICQYYQIFFSKLDTNLSSTSLIFLAAFLTLSPFIIKHYRSDQLIKMLLLWLFLPLFLLLFFVGNYGNLYDYYLTGFFPAFIMLFAIILFPGKKVKVYLLVPTILLFAIGNVVHIKNYLIAGVDGPTHITLGNEIQAVSTICQLAKKETDFNIAIYVPPVIPHAYNYLFSWYQRQDLCPTPNPDSNNLFTLYEVDPPHPERLNSWLDNLPPSTTILNQQFGGITIEKRKLVTP